MKQRVITVRDDATIGAAAALFRKYRIGTLPVVDPAGHLIGIVRLTGLISIIMPDFIRLAHHFEFVHDFGALEAQSPDSQMLSQKVQEIMDDPISVHTDSGLIMAASLLHERDLQDLPVVDQDSKVVGIASHVDIGVALMSNWDLPEHQGHN